MDIFSDIPIPMMFIRRLLSGIGCMEFLFYLSVSRLYLILAYDTSLLKKSIGERDPNTPPGCFAMAENICFYEDNRMY